MANKALQEIKLSLVMGNVPCWSSDGVPEVGRLTLVSFLTSDGHTLLPPSLLLWPPSSFSARSPSFRLPFEMDLFSSPPRSSQQHTRQRTATANSPQASTVKVPPTTPSTPSKRQQLNRRSRLSPAKVKTSHEWGTAGGFIDWDVDEDEGGGGPSPGRNPQQRVRTRLGSAVEPFL